jgi:hypothetical protein
MTRKKFSIYLGTAILGIALTTVLIATAQEREGDNQKKPSTVYVYNHNPKDTFDNNAEGWILQQLGLQNLSPIPEKNIIRNNNKKIIGYKSTDGTKEAYDVNSGFTTNEAWKRVGKNGELHIAKHGIERGKNFKGGGIQLDGGKMYNGFGNGTGADYAGKDGNLLPAYSLDKRPADSNIKINLNGCYTANDPDGDGIATPVTESAETTEGCSKVQGHTKKVFAKCSYKWEVTGLTTSIEDKVSEALKKAARKDGFPRDVAEWFSRLPATKRAQRLRKVIEVVVKALNIDPKQKVVIKVNITYEKNEKVPKNGKGGSYHVPTAVPLSGEGFVPFYYCESLLAAYLQVDPSTLLYSPIIHINQLGELPAPAPLGTKLASGLFEFETLNGEDAFTADVTIGFWTYGSPNEVEVLWLDSDTQTWNTPHGNLDVNYSDGHIAIETNTLGIYAAFRLEESVVIDDFESYTDNVELGEAVWQTWTDGREDPNNGSQVGYDEPPIMETEIVYSGSRSMPFFYNNIEDVTESVASRTFEPATDWSDYDTLSMWIYGDPNNTGGYFFIQVNEGVRVYDIVDLSEPSWQEVEVDLNSLDTNLETVTSLSIGVDGNDTSGIIYIGGISGIYTPQPIEPNTFIIDDFESYTDNVELGEAVWQTWTDGREDPSNGSQVGYDELPFMEIEIVHIGRQSMPFFYNNTEGVTESVASRTFEPPAEWKADMVHVWVDGCLDNTGTNFFIQVNGVRAYQNVDLSEPEWQEVEFDLETLDVDLEAVTSLGIGVDEDYVYGIIFIDDIKLSQTEVTE